MHLCRMGKINRNLISEEFLMMRYHSMPNMFSVGCFFFTETFGVIFCVFVSEI